jgi:hypothetical protein
MLGATIPNQTEEPTVPTAEQIRQFITGVIIPPIAGAIATWLASTQVFSIFHITQNVAVAEISQVLVFGVVTVITFLVSHNILKGVYTPAAKLAAGGDRLARARHSGV